MAKHIRKVKTGDSISKNLTADAFNYFLDTANKAKRSGTQTLNKNPRPDIDSSIVMIKNDTLSDIDQHSILGIDGILFTPTENENLFRNTINLVGSAPAAGTHEGKFAITLTPIKAGKLGYAVVDGLAVCKVIADDTEEHSVEIADTVTSSLRGSNSGSAELLYVEAGLATDARWAVVKMNSNKSARIDTFMISSSVQDGTKKRWTYTAKKASKTAAGYDGWAASTADTADYTLYSLAEEKNSTTGTFGNGITQSNIDAVNDGSGNFAMKPITNNTIVAACLEPINNEWWIINMPNGVDGNCGS